MLKPQPYYFEDIGFQLELNLQTIRRELIKLLEEYQFNECLSCDKLKCNCHCNLTSESGKSSNYYCYFASQFSKEVHFKTAPPANALPIPEWSDTVSLTDRRQKVSNSRINAWVRASISSEFSYLSHKFPFRKKVLNQINYSWPPFPKSIWSGEKANVAREREHIYCSKSDRDSVSSVEEFFRHFSEQRKNNTKNV